jgi:hypothetical protein
MDNMLAYRIIGVFCMIVGIVGLISSIIVFLRRKNKKPIIELVSINGVGIENFNDKQDVIISTYPISDQPINLPILKVPSEVYKDAVEKEFPNLQNEVVNKTEAIKGRIKVLKKKRKDKVKAKKKKTLKGK